VPDHDEAVNVDLEPEDALRILLGEERRELEPDTEEADGPEDDE
jgi:hypothetical protein